MPFGQIVERLADVPRPHSRPRESVITGARAHPHRSNHIYAQCDNGVGRGLGPFWLGGPVMMCEHLLRPNNHYFLFVHVLEQ